MALSVNSTRSSPERTHNVRETERSTQKPAETGASAPAQPEKPQTNLSVNRSDSFDTGPVGSASYQGRGPGGIETRAHAEGPSLKVDGEASANIDSSGVHLDLKVDVDATLAEAGAGATKTFTADVFGEKIEVEVSLDALGKIGADGSVNLNVDIGTDGVNVSASAEGFAGAQASLTGGITIRHDGNEIASGEATLSATAGVSGSASANLTLNGSEVGFEAKASASAGVGFGVEVSGSVNTANAANAVLEIGAAALREGVEEVAEFAADFGGEVADFAGDRAEDVVNLAEDVGGFVVDAGGAIVDAGKSAYDNTIGRLPGF